MKQKKPQKVIVNLFDFDQCLFNATYDKLVGGKYPIPEDSKAVIDANLKFFDELMQLPLAESSQYEITVINGSFSNRQTKAIDDHNSNNRRGGKTESSFVAIKKVNAYFHEILSQYGITVILENYLVSDTFHDFAPGDTFSGKNRSEKNHVFDTSKLSIAYPLIHKIKSQYDRSVPVLFRFCDDIYSIYHGLFEHFDNNPNWVPTNATVAFSCYDGTSIKSGEVRPVYSVKGTGEIDFNYEVNMKNMCYTGYGFLQRSIAKINLRECFTKLSTIKRFEHLKRHSHNIILNYQQKQLTPKEILENDLLKNFFISRCSELEPQRFSGIKKLTEVPITNQLLRAKSIFFHDTLLHLVVLLRDRATLLSLFAIGINLNEASKNFLGEMPVDLITGDSGNEDFNCWLDLPTREQFPEILKTRLEKKEYLRIKIAFHRNNLLKNDNFEQWITQVEKMINHPPEPFKIPIIDHPIGQVIANLVNTWHFSDYPDEDSDCTVSDSDTEIMEEDPPVVNHLQSMPILKKTSEITFGNIWSEKPVDTKIEQSKNQGNLFEPS